MRPSRRAPVGVVPEGVDVHAALGIGVVARDVPGDGGGGALGFLLEGHGALDVGVAPEDGDCARQQCLSSHNPHLVPTPRRGMGAALGKVVSGWDWAGSEPAWRGVAAETRSTSMVLTPDLISGLASTLSAPISGHHLGHSE